MKRFFSLNNWKRITILGTTIVAVIAMIVVVSVFYTSKNAKKSVEYGGGTEYVVQVESTTGSPIDVTQISQEIYERVDNLGIGGVSVEPETNGDVKTIRVTYPGTSTPSEIETIKNEITFKSHLVFTDVWGNPLFTSTGNFNRALSSTTSSSIVNLETFDWRNNTRVPLVTQGAYPFNQNGQFNVVLLFERDKASEWTEVTKYVSSLPEGKRQVVAWLNIERFIDLLKKTPGVNKSIWEESQKNPYNALFVDNNPATKKLRNSSDFLISNVSDYLVNDSTISQPAASREFLISTTSSTQAVNLARRLNFGSANYNLKPLFSNVINPTYGQDAFKKAVIAAIVVFSLIALLLIVNYGLLGALSTISIALFMFITLTLFTVMRGEYSPESIAALIIGIGMSVDANIITFERLKSELYNGNNLQKSLIYAQKKSFWTIFDANITTLIVAFVLFYFGTRNIVGLSITLMLSIALTLIVMLGFTRIMSSLLIQTGYFNNRLAWLGVAPKFDRKLKTKLDKIDFVKSSKYFGIFSGLVILAGVAVFVTMAVLAGNAVGGVVLSSDFKNGIIYQFNLDNTHTYDAAKALLIQAGFGENDFITEQVNGVFSTIKVITESETAVSSLANLANDPTWSQNFYFSFTSSALATKLVNDVLIAIGISIACIVVYSLIRFRWTYAFAAIFALIHDGLIVISIFVFSRLEISPLFVAGLLSILGYSINDTIVIFDRIREKMNAHKKNDYLDKKQVRTVANEAIRDTFKRSILTSLTTFVAVAVLMSFGDATKLTFNLVMLIGVIFGTYSSIFIASRMWVSLETIRQNRIQSRIKSNFWKTSNVEEQLVVGTNDFSF